MRPSRAPHRARAGLALGPLLLLLALLGCAAPPEVLFVEPNQIRAGEGSTVRVRVDGLTWEYNAFVDSAAATFEVEVGDTSLEDVSWLGATQLEGTVPTSVVPGLYPVTVRTAAGEDTLDDALLIRPAS